MSKTLINHLSESYILEDDNNSNKKFTEKIKGWIEAIRKRVLELGKILKEKILSKVGSLKFIDKDVTVSKFNKRRLENLKKELDLLKRFGDGLDDAILICKARAENYEKGSRGRRENEEGAKDYSRQLEMVKEKQKEIKRKIDLLNGDEDKISDSDKELVALKKSEAGNVFNTYKKLVKSEGHRIGKALTEISTLAAVILNTNKLKRNSKMATQTDHNYAWNIAIGNTLGLIAFSMGRIVRATGVMIKVGIVQAMNKNKGKDGE